MDLKGKRVLVTGAGGFIGGRLAERLAGEERARVRAFVRRRDPAALPAGASEIVVGDMTDASAVKDAIEGCEVIVHCAAKQSPPGMRRQFFAENVGGFEKLASAALACEVARFVHISTINVHGYPPPLHCNADSPYRESGDDYSDSKIATERLALEYQHERKLPLAIIRPACTYGPRGGAWTLTPLKRLRAGKRVLIGDGSFLCNPVFVDNLVDLIILAARDERAIGQAFIGATGIGIPWREFYGAYAKMLGMSHLNSVPLSAARAIAAISELVAHATRGRPWVSRQNVAFYSHRVVYDISKAQTMLGYTPRIAFDEGMQLTENWLRDTGQIT